MRCDRRRASFCDATDLTPRRARANPAPLAFDTESLGGRAVALNEELRAALTAYGAAALALLRDACSEAGGARLRPRAMFEFSGNGITSWFVNQHDFFDLLWSNGERLLALPEIEAVVQARASGNIPGSEVDARRDAVRIVHDYVASTLDLAFDELKFVERCAIYVPLWTDPRTKIVSTVVIRGLHSALADIRFSDGVVLSALTDDEKSAFCSDGFSFAYHTFDPGDLISCKFKLVVTRTISVHSLHRELGGAGRKEAGVVISALRLTAAGSVGALVIRTRFEPQPRADIGGSEGPTHELAVPAGQRECELAESEVPRLLETYARLVGADEGKAHEAMRIAVDRFNRSYTRSSHEDAIIDLTIALEATLLHGLEDELTYRLASRGAALLGRNTKDVFSRLKRLYSMRSKIVHEGLTLEKQLKGGTPAEFVEGARAIVRDVLVEYVRRLGTQTDLRQVNQDLDNRLLDGVAERES